MADPEFLGGGGEGGGGGGANISWQEFSQWIIHI